MCLCLVADLPIWSCCARARVTCPRLPARLVSSRLVSARLGSPQSNLTRSRAHTLVLARSLRARTLTERERRFDARARAPGRRFGAPQRRPAQRSPPPPSCVCARTHTRARTRRACARRARPNAAAAAAAGAATAKAATAAARLRAPTIVRRPTRVAARAAKRAQSRTRTRTQWRAAPTATAPTTVTTTTTLSRTTGASFVRAARRRPVRAFVVARRPLSSVSSDVASANASGANSRRLMSVSRNESTNPPQPPLVTDRPTDKPIEGDQYGSRRRSGSSAETHSALIISAFACARTHHAATCGTTNPKPKNLVAADSLQSSLLLCSTRQPVAAIMRRRPRAAPLLTCARRPQTSNVTKLIDRYINQPFGERLRSTRTAAAAAACFKMINAAAASRCPIRASDNNALVQSSRSFRFWGHFWVRAQMLHLSPKSVGDSSYRTVRAPLRDLESE